LEEQQSPNSLPLQVRPPKLLPQRPLLESGAEEAEVSDALVLEDDVLGARSVLLCLDMDRQEPKLD
jgi:hypothetical protein